MTTVPRAVVAVPAASADGPPAILTARRLVEGLAAAGVRHAVLCPGSRSAPLAFALQAADTVGLIRLHVRIDERSAAFTALGMARATGDPALVVTTSGTAVANLLPAVLEAHHSGVAMIVVSADRPARLRGTWANQTSDLQAGLLGGTVRRAWDVEASADPGHWRELAAMAVSTARGTGEEYPGPVHVNLGFDEPLVPADLEWSPAAVEDDAAAAPRSAAPSGDGPQVLVDGPTTVVVAGDGAGPAARRLAEAAGWPLLAEPTSGARGGANAIAGYRLVLDSPLGRAVERVVVFGRPTLSRPVTRLLARSDVELVLAGEHPGAGNAGRPSRRVSLGVGIEPPSDRESAAAWLAAWQEAGARARTAIESVLAHERTASGELSGYDVAREVVAATGPGAGVVVAASNAIRDADLAAGAVTADFAIANRGLSGIDGTLSTAAGAALASGSPVRVLVGDLAFLHDGNALLLGPGEPVPSVQVVVVNDRGGGIFGLLEPGEAHLTPAFERIFGTPQHVDFAALCDAYAVPHMMVGDLDGLRRATAGPPGPGFAVVEVQVERARERALAQRLAAAVAQALAGSG